jgi:hypothetical protein
MADSLLDFDYNTMIDKALGTTNQPFKGLINDPNYQSSLNVNTLLGLGQGYFDSLYKDKTTGQKVISTLTGGKIGRQKGINDAVTSLFNQQKYNKNLADLTKAKQDILINQDKIGAFGEEALIRQNKIIDLQNKNYLTSLRNVGIKDRFKQLQEKADGGDLDALKKLQQFAVDPQKYMEFEQTKDINNLDYSQGEVSASRMFNLDVRNRTNWTDEQEANFNKVVNAPSVQEAAKINRENMAAHRADPMNVPFVKVLNVNEEIARIRKNNRGAINGDVAEKVMEKAMPIGRIEPNEQYPEGGFKANNGKIYTLDEWNNLGIDYQQAYSRDRDRGELNKEIDRIDLAAKQDYASSQYGVRSIERTNLALERLLDNPEKFQKLFDTDGRLKFKFNELTGNYVAELGSDAQDIVNLLNTVAGQQFTNEIQIMRQNNKTGGAVGNVSDKEVEMFKNMAANIRYSGSAEELWYQLNLLRGQGKKTAEIYTNSFKDYYGEKQYNRYKVDKLMPEYTKEYNTSFKQSLNKSRGNTVTNKINNITFSNPQSQSIMNQLLGIE